MVRLANSRNRRSMPPPTNGRDGRRSQPEIKRSFLHRETREKPAICSFACFAVTGSDQRPTSDGGALDSRGSCRCLFWNREDISSTLSHGGSDQPQTSLRLVCRCRSRENEALGIRPRDATTNRPIVDSVDHEIRQQYLVHQRLTLSPQISNQHVDRPQRIKVD